MTDYWPSIRTIVAIFYFAFWFFKDAKPFSLWWLVAIYVVDYIVAMIILSLTTSIAKRTLNR
jgi:hypothetical protein